MGSHQRQVASFNILDSVQYVVVGNVYGVLGQAVKELATQNQVHVLNDPLPTSPISFLNTGECTCVQYLFPGPGSFDLI